MKKDLKIPKVKNVTLAIARNENGINEHYWEVYLLNRNNHAIENVLVASKGYGKKNGEEQLTSTLRHFFDEIGPESAIMVEPIQEDIFHLNNEYWVSYYVDNKIYDKKFVFVPDSIRDENLILIKELSLKGVLHS